MTFGCAREKLRSIYKGQYCSVGFEVSEFTNAEGKTNTTISCKLYVDKLGWFQSNTWEGAFDALEVAVLGLTEKIIEDRGPKGDN